MAPHVGGKPPDRHIFPEPPPFEIPGKVRLYIQMEGYERKKIQKTTYSIQLYTLILIRFNTDNLMYYTLCCLHTRGQLVRSHNV